MSALFVLHAVYVSSAVARTADRSQVHATPLDPDVASMRCLSAAPIVRAHAADQARFLLPVPNPASAIRRFVAAASINVPGMHP
jgi:hypothetical protein